MILPWRELVKSRKNVEKLLADHGKIEVTVRGKKIFEIVRTGFSGEKGLVDCISPQARGPHFIPDTDFGA